jgi:hypothetical protein
VGGASPASLRHRPAPASAVAATALALTVAALTFPAPASAAQTVINFDDLPAHTTVGNQYAAEGLTLDRRPSGPAELHPFVEAPPQPAEAHSPPNVLDISHGCGSEFTYAELWGRFAAPRNYVKLFVGNVYPETIAETQRITLQGYDLGGNAIPGDTQTVEFSGLGVNTEATIFDPESQISFFGITSPDPTFCPVAIDDLGFEEVPGTIPPDFGLAALGSGVALTPGASAEVTLRLNRTATSAGPISLSFSGLPSGVTAEAIPNPTSGGDGSTLAVRFTAAGDAPPESGANVTVTGTPSPSAGVQPHSIQIPVEVSGSFDLRAQGLEVTQGIQPEAHSLEPSGGESGVDYRGVDLIAHKRTAVRLFADAHGEHLGKGISGVDALMFGYRNGQPLPGSPLHPDYGPARLLDTGALNPPRVFEWERQTNDHAYTFTLPDSWAWGNVKLVGHLYQEPAFPQAKQPIECSSASCKENDSFTVNGVAFHETQDVMLTTIALRDNGQLPSSAASEMVGPKLVSPLADSGYSWKNPNAGFTVLPYEGTIDISDIINAEGNNKGAEVKGRVDQWASDMGHPNFGTIGIGPGNRGEFRASTGGGTSAVVSEPIVASHELFHLFGLKHASYECGGGDDGDSDDEGEEGVPWPLKPGDDEDTVEAQFQGPEATDTDHNFGDGFGQLLGFGLDMRTTPFTILADGLHKVPEYYDFMTYCFVPSLGEGGDWVSPINWEAVYHRFAIASGSSAAVARASEGALARPLRRKKPHGPVASLNPRTLRVIGYETSAGFEITSVGPRVGPALPGGSSAYALRSLGAHGQVLTTVPMHESNGHADGVGPLDELTGELPAHGVERIEVLSNGVPVAGRSRPRHRPHVRVLAPRRGSRVGGRRRVLVRWRTRGHGRLSASIDYSRDGGRRWRTILVGPDSSRASLPAFYFAGSRRARVRVRVNDGFNEAVAVSAPFASLGAPPRVSIEKPLAAIAGDARLGLSGQAVDQEMRVLGRRRLRWFDGRFPLGRGAEISAGPLPAGKNHIRLVATDAAGRMGSAQVTVKVTPVRLPFLKLRIPKSVPRAARRLSLAARSAVPTVLAIGKHRFRLRAGKKARLRVPIGGGPLLLRLIATARGIETPFAVAVKRR